MLNLPEKLILALKQRSNLSNESMSHYCTRVLSKSLGLEEKTNLLNDFHRWCNHHLYPEHYRFDRKFYEEELEFLVTKEIMKEPSTWTKAEERKFKDVFALNSRIKRERGVQVEDVMMLPQIHGGKFMEAYKVFYTVKE